MNIQEALNFLKNRHNVIGEERSFEGAYSQYSISFLTKVKEHFGYNKRTKTVYGIYMQEDGYDDNGSSITFEGTGKDPYNENEQELIIQQQE